MKSLKTLLLLAMLMALATSMSAISPGSEEPKGKNRFLSDRVVLTCNKNPNVCYIKGSAGSDCCMSKCVNLSTDVSNCGKCGKKCSYGEICCEGKCVNPQTNEKHCGKCGNKCNAESSCIYGMCSYA
ncbi:Stigma-specific STIG protein 1 [Spatholobus suberectus]|nr:Stigma-specific STIG protein 1 [Spatholobus suberectus]